MAVRPALECNLTIRMENTCQYSRNFLSASKQVESQVYFVSLEYSVKQFLVSDGFMNLYIFMTI